MNKINKTVFKFKTKLQLLTKNKMKNTPLIKFLTKQIKIQTYLKQPLNQYYKIYYKVKTVIFLIKDV